MMTENITDNDLMEFCKWYAGFHGATDIEPSVIETCLCGYFHTFAKAANKLLMRCKKLKLVAANGDTVNIVLNNIKLTDHVKE